MESEFSTGISLISLQKLTRDHQMFRFQLRLVLVFILYFVFVAFFPPQNKISLLFHFPNFGYAVYAIAIHLIHCPIFSTKFGDSKQNDNGKPNIGMKKWEKSKVHKTHSI